MKLKNKIFGISIVLFFFGGIFFYNNIQKINKQDGINITQKYNTGNIVNSSGNTNLLGEEILNTLGIKDDTNKTLINYYNQNKLDINIDEKYSGKYKIADKISFLDYCNKYIQEGFNFKKYTDLEKIVNSTGSLSFFKTKCFTKTPGSFEGVEKEEELNGCNVEILFYYYKLNKISKEELYKFLYNSNNKLILGGKDELLYFMLKDILNGKSINSNTCESYLDMKYE